MQSAKYTTKQQQLLTMFSSQHSQINQDEFQNLASLLLNNSNVYAEINLKVEKKFPLHLPLELDAFRKQRTS